MILLLFPTVSSTEVSQLRVTMLFGYIISYRNQKPFTPTVTQVTFL